MALALLGLNRALVEEVSSIGMPKTSLVMSNFDRTAIESLRVQKNISVSMLEDKIGLTKSRYYRWVHNEVDLPMEVLIGIKKLLGMSDYEFMSLIGPETDEVISTLCLMEFSLFNDRNVEYFGNVLQKHRKNAKRGDPYLLLIDMYELLTSMQQDDVQIKKKVEKLQNFFPKIESYTLMDVIILSTLQLIITERSGITERIDDTLLKKWILKNVCCESAHFRRVAVGFAVDFSLRLHKSGKNSSSASFLLQVKNTMSEYQVLDDYSCFIIDKLVELIITSRLTKKQFMNGFDKIRVALPILEYNFWNNLMDHEGMNK